MSYDHWKTTEPYNPDNETDDREHVNCDLCDRWIVDGASDNVRIGRLYCCPECGNKQETVAQGRYYELIEDTARGK